jgi:hypothetical protein
MKIVTLSLACQNVVDYSSCRMLTEVGEFVLSVRANWIEQKEKPMKQETFHESEDELRPHYELTQLLKDGVRGKYVERYRSGTNLALLEPEIAEAFPTDDDVNNTLRHLLTPEPGSKLHIPISALLTALDALDRDELMLLHRHVEEKLAA